MKISTEQLCRLLGSEEAAQKFVDLFRQQLPEQLNTLRQALNTGDWETASLTAHGLKSQCRYLGLEAAADMLRQIENDPTEHPIDEAIWEELSSI